MSIKNFYLYGCNHRSEIVFRKLQEFGANVISFVDSYKKGHNIISPQDLESLTDKDNVCIYLCMQNAIQHEIVADMFFHMGFHYIIFLPVSDKYNMQAYKMINLWNSIYEGDGNFLLDIPRYENFIGKEKMQNSNVLYVPMELIFTGREFMPVNNRWESRHISLYESYNQLYRHIYESGELPYEYLQNNFALFWEKRKEIIKDRIVLYENLSQRIRDDSLYYRAMTCPVEASGTGIFILQDGHHRANLAFHLGKDFLPVRIHAGKINYQQLNDFMRERNYKLFLLLSDIVLSVSDFMSCSIFSVDNKQIIMKYMKLLSRNKNVNVFVTDDMQCMKQADLRIVFKRNIEDAAGSVYINTDCDIFEYMKSCYVFDNCRYHIYINEENGNDFA